MTSFTATKNHQPASERALFCCAQVSLNLLPGEVLHSDYSGYRVKPFFMCIENALMSGICFAFSKCQRSFTVEGLGMRRHARLSMPRWQSEMELCGSRCVCSLPSREDELPHSWSRWWTHIVMTFCLSVCLRMPAVLYFVSDMLVRWRMRSLVQTRDSDMKIWPNWNNKGQVLCFFLNTLHSLRATWMRSTALCHFTSIPQADTLTSWEFNREGG